MISKLKNNTTPQFVDIIKHPLFQCLEQSFQQGEHNTSYDWLSHGTKRDVKINLQSSTIHHSSSKILL